MDERALFDGKEFEVDDETWVVKVENDPGASANDTDLRVFDLALRRKQDDGDLRRVRLLASHAGIQVEDHAPMLHQRVRDFLRTGQSSGRVECF